MTIGTDNSINKPNGDNQIHKMNPVSQVQAVPKDNASEKTEANVSLNRDGGKVQASKGNIPASGLFLNESETPAFVKNIEKVIQNFTGNKEKLDLFLNSLDSININGNLDQLSDRQMMALVMLGLDLSMEHGELVILDKDGNKIDLQDFSGARDKIDNTIKRAMSAGNSSGMKAADSSQISMNALKDNLSNSVTELSKSPAAQALIKFVEETFTQDYQDIKAGNEVDQNIQKQEEDFKAQIKAVQDSSAKIDKGIDEINKRQEQLLQIQEKMDNGTITESDKKRASSLASEIKNLQSNLLKEQEGTDLLLKQAEATFSQFSPHLSDSERNTMEGLQSALKAKVNGQELTLRQNFLANVSEEIFMLTSNMSDEQLDSVLGDPKARIKMLAPTNKLLDRAISAASTNDLSASDINNLWTKFKIKAVNENGKIELYYYSSAKANPVKVSKEELKSLKTDLNNIVNSPELFNLARASGEISSAYNVQESGEIKFSPNNHKNNINDLKGIYNNNDSGINLDSKYDIFDFADEVSQKKAGWAAREAIDKNFEKRQEEQRYHEKQIESIHSRRREINQYLENKRIQDKLLEND